MRTSLRRGMCLTTLTIYTLSMTPYICPHSEDREHRIFLALLHLIPGLEARLLSCSAEEVRLVADLV
jgi:hypothetical protein